MKQNSVSNIEHEQIAIIGIGCRFPGGITSPTTFWDFLLREEDGTREVPESRWSLERHYDPARGKPGKLYVRRGGFIDDVKGFDPQFFGISPREAASMDPQQRLLLETTWEAFEDAGIPASGLAQRKVGVFVGLFTHDYENLHMLTSERHLQSPHSATGMSTTISANRLSYAFDFMGPSMVIDTACSSSLVAVHLAARSLQAGESEIAVAAGVNLQLSPEMTMALCNASMLSPDGRSMSFDARANGYARADGVGVVVLKPLASAMHDGDPIYAVIAGSAVNQDGHTPGISVPNEDAQKIVMRDALAAAGIAASDLTYVEAHGTGTPVGDPIEARALGTILSADMPERAPCVIGSIKSNFGHSESAAGVAGLIKVALMQHHGRIPANLHFETPNPNIPFDALRIRVPTAAEDWPTNVDGRRFAGINSFGFGGTNAHVILARAPDPAEAEAATGHSRQTLVLPLSARSKEALQDSAAKLESFLRAPEAAHLDLDEIAATLALGRSHLDERLVIAASDHEAAANLLADFREGHRVAGIVKGQVTGGQQQLAFICSGMGQQWWGMGRGLLASEPVFAAKIAEVDALLSRLDDNCSLAEMFASDEKNSQIDQTINAQRAIFAVQVAQAALWQSVGIYPDFVVGHSVGEVAAAHIAGALSLEDAVTIIFHRSRLQARLAGHGGMLAIGLSEAESRPYLKGIEDLVSLAAVNSPGSVTFAGDTQELQRLLEHFEARQIFARLLNVEVPYHSPAMDQITTEVREALRGIAPRSTHIPLVSTVTGQRIDGETFGGDYWVRNVREPVYFHKAMQTLVGYGCSIFAELGAHPVLANSINECLADEGANGGVIATQRRKQDDTVSFWSAFGQLFCLGVEVPFDRLYRRNGRRVAIPTYPWQKAQYWLESKASHLDRTGRETDDGPKAHPLLGDRQASPHPTWRAGIGPLRPAFLKDHQVQDSVVFPAAGYVEAALAAHREESGSGRPLVLEKIKIESPLVLEDSQSTYLQTSLSNEGTFEIHSLTGNPDEHRWSRHVTGTMAAAQEQYPSDLDWEGLQERLPQIEDSRAFYSRFDGVQLNYGPSFQNVENAWLGRDEVLAYLRPSIELDCDQDTYILHPALLDSTFQLLAGLPDNGTFLPVAINRITVFQPGAAIAWAHMELTSQSKSRIEANIVVANQDGETICLVEGFTCQLFASADRSTAAAEDDFLFKDSWVEEPLQSNANWPVAAASLPELSSLAERLQTRHTARDTQGTHRTNIFETWPDLDGLALEYFAEALVELGCNWKVGQHIATCELMDTRGIAAHHQRYLAHMLGLLENSGALRAEQDGWRVLRDINYGAAATHWRELVRKYPQCHAELVLIQRCGAGLAQFLLDADDVHFVLFPKGCPIAEQLYTDSPILKPYNRILADLVHDTVAQLPEGGNLRILEIGAGTGGLAAHLLPLLPPERTEYVFTDLSDRFLGQARQRFSNRPFMRYEKLDLETGPAEQGFACGTFDLILGGNVVHATTNISASLGRLHDLLKPGGAIGLIELTRPSAWHDLIFGLFPGWWVFSDSDVRQDHATLPSAGWLESMTAAGFEQGKAIVDDFGEVAGPHSVLLAKKSATTRANASAVSAQSIPESQEPTMASRSVIVLGDETDMAAALSDQLKALGAHVKMVPPGGNMLPDAMLNALTVARNESEDEPPVIVDLRNVCRHPAPDAETTPSNDATQRCTQLQAILETLADLPERGRHALWVVTNGAVRIGEMTAAPNLGAAALWGFARTAINEIDDVDTRLVDLSTAPDPSEIAALAREILADRREPEIALRKTRRHVSRVHRWYRPRPTEDDKTCYEVRRSMRARPDDLTFHEASPPPPGEGEVQLRIHATGINFKDHAIHSGLVTTDAGDLGLEGSGVVLSTGPGVEALAPGDAVFGLVHNGLNRVINVRADALVAKPENLTFEEAAGIPVAFLSAYHALKRKAGLRAGQTVLIHTATSGLGLAAILVAQALGARVLATAGTPEKRAYLKAMGIEYVGDSRTARFAREVMEFTGGDGVDVVLNTLPASLNDHNFGVLKPGTGWLIDVANVHYESRLAYSDLVRGLSVTAFDLTILAQDDLADMHALLGELAALFASGTLRPLPCRTISIERLSEVLHSVRSATHVGKLIISHTDSYLHLIPETRHIELAKDGSYLITGGLTGFGLTMAKWFAECGAGCLVLVGRRGADTPEAAPVLAELKAAGIKVHAIACDVSDREQMAALINRFGRDLPPLRGIVHGAMVLRDGPLRDMAHEDIRSVLAPKLDGAWHLHQLTQNQPLDFFVSHSSFSSLVGNRDQANYAAANRYLEALMDYRHSMGQPGLAIAWGVIGETGTVARDQEAIEIFTRQGVYALAPAKAWAAITAAIGSREDYLGAIVADWRKLGKFARVIANTPRFSLIVPSATGRATFGTDAELQENDADNGPQDVATLVVREIAGVLGLAPESILLDKPLAELGFDSLMAVELSLALELATGQSFSRMSLLRADLTAGDLVAVIGEHSPDRQPAGKVATKEPASATTPAPAVDVTELSDAEVEALLLKLSDEG